MICCPEKAEYVFKGMSLSLMPSVNRCLNESCVYFGVKFTDLTILQYK